MKKPVNADCEDLNRRYGAPGRIVFRPSPDTGVPVVVLANKYGTAEIDLLGAHVFSYRPTGQQQVLFMPKTLDRSQGKWRHGGVPVCWPWFSGNGEPGSASHGMARTQVFAVKATEYSEDATEITLALVSDAETKKLWPYDFELEVKVSVSMSLNLTLTSTNTGAEKFWVTEGFHPYFLVRDAVACKVRGVDGKTFCDTLTQPAPFTKDSFAKKWEGDLVVEGERDHVFDAPNGEYALFDPGVNRTIVIRSRGNKKLIVWHPAPSYSEGKIGPGEGARMVCVEPATIFRDEGYWLEPGAKHELRMAIQSDPNDGSVHARN